MIKIEYTVETKTVKTKRQEAENEKFIAVRHYDTSGVEFVTAFIGKGEKDRNKSTITISVDFFEIQRMYGSAMTNAVDLLKKNERNTVISNAEFLEIFEKKKLEFIDSLNLKPIKDNE